MKGAIGYFDAVEDSGIKKKKLKGILCIAAESNQLELVEFLVYGRVVPLYEEDDNTLTVACSLGHLRIVRFLLEMGLFDHAHQDALVAAAEEGQIGAIKLLVAAGADVHYDEQAALMAAVECNQLKSIKYLVEKCGCDLLQRGPYELLEIMHDEKETAELFIELEVEFEEFEGVDFEELPLQVQKALLAQKRIESEL